MPPLLVLDLAALGLCTLLSATLTVIVGAAGVRKPLNLAFSAFVFFAGAQAAFSLLLRLSLFYSAGNPLLLLQLAVACLFFMCPFFFLFVAHYIRVGWHWPSTVSFLALAGMAALLPLLFQGKFVLHPWLDAAGITHFDLTAGGYAAGAIVPVLLALCLLVLLAHRSRDSEAFIGISAIVMLVGYLIGSLTVAGVPVLSIATTISVVILGSGIIRRQLFNPLRELAADLQERSHRQALIAQVGRRTTAILELEEMLTQAVDLIKDSFAYATVSILLIEEDQLVLRASSLPLVHSHGGKFRLKIGSEGICGWVAASGKHLYVPDVERDSRYVSLSNAVRTRSELAVPIRRGSEVIGVLDIQSPSPDAFGRGDAAAQQTVADQLSSSIQNARLYEKLRRELASRQRTERFLHSLNAAALAMEQALIPAEIFPIVIRELSALGLSCVIFLADETGRKLAMACRSRAGGGLESFAMDGDTTWFDISGVPTLAEALRRQVTLSLEVDKTMTGVLPPLSMLRPGEDSRRAVFAPLSAMDELIGLLCLSGEGLGAEELPMFRAFAYQAGAAWRKARLMQDLQSSLGELSRTQEQLLHSQKMEAIGRLAGGVAHDFNNLLTVISGYAALLSESVADDATASADLGEIKNTVKRAAGLTARLLAFSRRQITQPTVMDLNGVVAGSETLLRPLLGEDVELLVRRSPLPVCVHADPYQLEQVIINLAVNARDAMPKGGRLTLETDSMELKAPGQDADRAAAAGLEPAGAAVPLDLPGGSYGVLRVQDTGVGMSEDVKTHLFEPFFTTKEHGKGTGLGLSIVYGIITQAGGRVRVDSSPGAGSTFTIWLPRASAGTDCAGAEETPAAGPGGSGTVLLVEDEPEVRLLTRRILEQGGYVVLAASSPREALSIAEGPAGIDMTVTDVVMPGGMSGLEMGERLSRTRPGMPVLYMSGYAEDDRLTGGSPDASLPFLSKPFLPEELLRRVSELMRKRG